MLPLLLVVYMYVHDNDMVDDMLALTLIDMDHVGVAGSSVLLNKSWTGKRDDLLTKQCASATGAAIHTNLQPNGGTLMS